MATFVVDAAKQQQQQGESRASEHDTNSGQKTTTKPGTTGMGQRHLMKSSLGEIAQVRRVE